MKDLLVQNLDVEEKIKVMIISNSPKLRQEILSSFLDNNDDITVDSDLEIKKKTVKLLNKSICCEFFNTGKNFHTKDTSKIYYKLSNAFLVVVDVKDYDLIDYIYKTYRQVNDSTSAQNFICIAKNFCPLEKSPNKMSVKLKNFCVEHGIVLFPLGDKFKIENANVNNLFSLLYLKNIGKGYKTNKNKENSNSSNSKKGKENKNSLKFDDEYSLKFISALDFPAEDQNSNVRRKWSFNDANISK